jgi:HEAT repeat protein
LPALLKAAQDNDRQVRERAVWALGEVAPSDKRVVACLVRALKDEDLQVRLRAAIELFVVTGCLKAEDIPVRALIDALNDPDARIRRVAIKALEHVGPAAKDALPALNGALHDPDPVARADAEKAVATIQGR